MNSGIYQIVNSINGKYYIGSSENLEKRKLRHFNELKKNRHHNIYLQRAYNKHGNIFKFEILELIESEKLFEREQYYINTYKPEYNLGSVGGGDCISQHPRNQEFRELQSRLTKERYANLTDEEKEEYSRKMSKEGNPNWQGGKTFFECPICHNIIRTTQKQKTCSKCRDRTSSKNPFYGKTHSKETKEKLRLKQLGKKPINTNKIEINGTVYESQADAAKALGVSGGLITYRLKKNYPGYKVIQ
jgi:group I intron endonuclease